MSEELPRITDDVFTDFGKSLQTSCIDEMKLMRDEIEKKSEELNILYQKTREIFKNTTQISFDLHTGQMDNVDNIIKNTKEYIESILKDDNDKRDGNLSLAIQKFSSMIMFREFFNKGELLSPTELNFCNDEEYLGASLGLAQELTRYAVQRAIEADIKSIEICRKLVLQLNSEMLQFDFRNGPLRRKYDGLKYSVKKLEEITYDLSLTEIGNNQLNIDEPPNKKQKVEEHSLLDRDGFKIIRERMEKYDQLRENVIKMSRDVQKLSKQAIFSVHRGNIEDAHKKLNLAEQKALPILEITKEHPTLRNGSFTNSLEEWAEGVLTLEWVEKKRILPKAAMQKLDINTHEYLGALSDFSGEAGRIAIAAASKRDVEYVRKIQMALLVIANFMMQANPSNNKKVDAVSMTTKKIENVLYDLNLLKLSGRQKRSNDAEN